MIPDDASNFVLFGNIISLSCGQGVVPVSVLAQQNLGGDVGCSALKFDSLNDLYCCSVATSTRLLAYY